MRALVIHQHGPIENLKLESFPEPRPATNEVLIDVHATSVNFPDILVVGGTYQKLPPTPFVPGKDLYMWVAAFDHVQTRHSRHPRPVRIVTQE